MAAGRNGPAAACRSQSVCQIVMRDMRQWDLFCAVVDNYGDIGTCWRLVRQLADEHDIQLRLWVDRLETFAQLCSEIRTETSVQHVGQIEVRHWTKHFPVVDPGDVVVEAFACQIPDDFVARMAQRPQPPVWINLEYLSAESWVDECHRLPSPHPKLPLTKYFFFPGFTTGTGGVPCERNL